MTEHPEVTLALVVITLTVGVLEGWARNTKDFTFLAVAAFLYIHLYYLIKELL